MRKLKKGFTIIELIIVIAVIAVLTAVLVPTFVHLSKRARDVNDKSIVTNANIQLAAQEGLQGKNRSMSEAVKDVDEIGYHMSTIPTGNGNKIVWDSVTDRFALLDKDNNVLLSDGEVSSHDKLFYAVSSLDERGDFAVYAKSGYSGTTAFTSETGIFSFDAGEKEGIETISYTFSSAGTVLVVTNSEHTTLNVDASLADFEHVGLCGTINIIHVAPDTFADYGHVGFVQIDSGHYVADTGADVKAVYATSNEAKIDKLNGGNIGTAYGASGVTNPNGNVALTVTIENSTQLDNAKNQAASALDQDINPPVAPQGIALTQESISNGKFEILEDGYYYLDSDIDVTDETSRIWVNSTSNKDEDGNQINITVTIDLNGHILTNKRDAYGSSAVQVKAATLNLVDSRHSDHPGQLRNDGGTAEDNYALELYNGSTLNLDHAIVGGDNPRVIGALGGTIHIYANASEINGLIMASICTIYLHTPGQYRLSYEGIEEGIAFLAPTVKDGNGATINKSGTGSLGGVPYGIYNV